MNWTFFLASTSKYRRAQLETFGISPHVLKPDCDEDSYKGKGYNPIELTRVLSSKKAESVLSVVNEGIVMGGDQLVSFQGAILGKAGTLEKAAQQLQQMQGQWHELITTIHLIKKSSAQTKVKTETVVTRLKMRSLNAAELKAYVEQDQTQDCAGSYKIEKGGWSLFEKVESEDPSSIMGIPLMKLTSVLIEFGYSFPFTQQP